MDQHRADVAAVASQVRYFYERKLPFRIYHGHTTTSPTRDFQQDQIVDTSKLNHVLSVNRLKHTVLVEPSVSMEELVHFTLKTGQIPKVVMEFKNITAGGGFAGTSGQSSSFKHGYFEDTVCRIEIVLANGDIVNASRTDNAELLHAAAGSHGSFGIITLLEIELQQAAQYVKLECLPFNSPEKVIGELERAATDHDSHHFVDGKLLSPELGIVMVGELTHSVPNVEVVTFTNSWDEWFYTFIAKRLERDPSSTFTIAVPLLDYLFRYERGAYWAGHFGYDYFWLPFNRYTRYLLDSLSRTNVVYHAMDQSRVPDRYIMQDITFPSSKVGQYIEYIFNDHGIAPLWLCPLRKAHRLPFDAHSGTNAADPALKEDVLINVGTWGPGPKQPGDYVKANRDIENKTRELWGGKSLYARSFYTEDEFWEIYDRKRYEELRTKYYATTLPDIFEKTRAQLDYSRVAGKSTLRDGLVVWWSLTWYLWVLAGLYAVYHFGLLTSKSRGNQYIAKP